MSAPRPGRARRFDVPPIAGFANPDAARYVAALDELAERLFDLIGDLPPAALDFVPQGGTNSIAMLVRHIAAAEAGWITQATASALPAPSPIPPDLQQLLAPGRQDKSGELPASSLDAAQLIAVCRRVRDEITKPRLSPLADIDVETSANKRVVTLRGMLVNQLWHWTYHTGQIGLLRRLGGERYRWAYGDRIAPPRPAAAE